MQTVGESTCNRDMVLKRRNPSLHSVLQALALLHRHQLPIIHGDPRLPNLLLCGQRLVWTDLFQEEMTTDFDPIEFSSDMSILAGSLFPDITFGQDPK